jgi:hypothetical protein
MVPQSFDSTLRYMNSMVTRTIDTNDHKRGRFFFRAKPNVKRVSFSTQCSRLVTIPACGPNLADAHVIGPVSMIPYGMDNHSILVG